jgi:hypothetical protein
MGRWLSGASPNPGGKGKAEIELRKLARSFGPESIFAMVKLMRGAKSEKVRGDMANALLDRGFGRAFQQEVPGDEELEEIRDASDEAIDKVLDS